jgi:cell division septal protein FtsQ
LVAVLIGCFVKYACDSRMFMVTENTVRVEHSELAPVDRLEAIAKEAVAGKFILGVNKRKTEAEAKKLPEVRDARVELGFPNKVRLIVAEYAPLSSVADGSRYFVINSEGLIFHICKNPVEDLPVIRTPKPLTPRPVRGEKVKDKTVKIGMDIIAASNREEVPLSEVRFDSNGNICLNMKCNVPVKFGNAEDIDLKMEILSSFMNKYSGEAKNAEYIDVSCPSGPVWKPGSARQTCMR